MTIRDSRFMPDHGMLLGTTDDDHVQYYNLARLTAWYGTQPPNTHTHVEADITDLGNYTVVGHLHLEADITDLGSYSLTSHTHDTSHNHDSDYVEIGGDTMQGVLDMGGYTLHADRVNFGDQTSYGLGQVTGNYGTVQTIGTGVGSYEGYSINGHFVFMSNGTSNFGLYDDVNNRWAEHWNATDYDLYHLNGGLIIHADVGSYTYLYYSNAWKLRAESTGIHVSGEVSFSGADDWAVDGGDDFNIREGGTPRFRIRDDYNDGYFEFMGTNGTMIAALTTDDLGVRGAIRAGLAPGGTLTNGYFYGIIPTTGAAANAYWAVASGSTYYALRFSSSARYKKEINTFKGKIEGVDVSVLNLTPSIYRGSEGTPVFEDIPDEERKFDKKRGTYDDEGYRHKKDKDGHFLYRHDFNNHLSIGLIAEDVAENFPSGAVFDETGRPESVDWNNIIAGMLYEMQKMRVEIDELQSYRVTEERAA